MDRPKGDGASRVPEIWVRQVAEEVLRRMGSGNAQQPGGFTASSSSPAPLCAGSPQSSAAPASSTQCAQCSAPCMGAQGAEDHHRVLLEHGVERLTCCTAAGAVDLRLASMIDHTLLKPEATDREIARLCEEAHCHGFATVCIQPIWVALAARILQGSRARVCTVIGFPHGANRHEVKAYETQLAVAQGAREIDMVLPIGAMKSGDLPTVSRHIRSVVRAALPGIVTKVILETAFLSREEKVAACRIAREEGATFVKTSTGFGPSGATLEDVRLMRETVGPQMGVKAAGGIRDRQTALRMLEAGATRIGASASIRIAAGAN